MIVSLCIQSILEPGKHQLVRYRTFSLSKTGAWLEEDEWPHLSNVVTLSSEILLPSCDLETWLCYGDKSFPHVLYMSLWYTGTMTMLWACFPSFLTCDSHDTSFNVIVTASRSAVHGQARIRTGGIPALFKGVGLCNKGYRMFPCCHKDHPYRKAEHTLSQHLNMTVYTERRHAFYSWEGGCSKWLYSFAHRW